MSLRPKAGMTRRTFIIAAGSLALVSLAACSATEDPTPQPSELTLEQAELLATFRFKNYLAEQVSYQITGPDTFPVSGTVVLDTQAHTGRGRVSAGDAPDSLVVWGQQSVFTCVDAAAWEDLASWSGRDIGQSDIDSFLLMLLLLSSDRPENAQLLQQSGAVWLGTETVNGVECDVFTGPGDGAPRSAAPETSTSPVRYYLDSQGVLQFFSARVTNEETSPWTATRIEEAPAIEVPDAVWDAMRQASEAADG